MRGKRNKRTVLVTSGLLGLIAITAIGLAFYFWVAGTLENRERKSESVQQYVEPVKKIKSKFLSPSEEEAISIVKRALANRDPEAVPALFRTGSASPEEIVRYFKESDQRDGPVSQIKWLSSLDSDGMLIEGALVSFKSEEKKERLALLTPDDKGNWRFDFEAYARSMTISWEDLLANRANQARVRVMIAMDPYYNGVFSDEKKWTSYTMSSPDMDQLLQGYCLNGSQEAETLARLSAESQTGTQGQITSLFPSRMKNSRVILELSRVAGAGPKQFQITRVLAREWLLPDGVSPEK